MKYIYLFLFPLIFIFYDKIYAISIGKSVEVRANELTTITYSTILFPTLSIQLTIEVDTNSTILFDFVSSSRFTFPKGFSNFDFEGNFKEGFKFLIFPSTTKVLNATLIFNDFLFTYINKYITEYLKVGIIQVDITTNATQEIDINISPLSKTISISLPSAGYYYFSSFSFNITLPTFFGTWRDIKSNITQAFSYNNNLFLKIKSEAEAKLLVTMSKITSYPLPHMYINVTEYFDITFDRNSLFNATLYVIIDINTLTNMV
jgi:hypothetical protein